ncbi:uncharacterized protein [Lolium perenne]|uniref:uncharacterized protein n=1 Tax=Lolium perenne TaxID=4522 RepID=UPI003A99B834
MLPHLLASSECFALRAEHNGKFLQPVHHARHGGIRIEASADTTAGNARARFFLEPSKEHQGLVHIRYCYNNAYWVLVADSDDDRRYVSAADEPHEDLSRESCTLFEPIPVEGNENSIRIRIAQSGSKGGYATMVPVFDISKPYLQFHKNAESSFTVIGGSEEITVTQDYTVPPGKTVIAKFVTMRASCDVPYSYSQNDVLTNGEEVTTFHKDGIYTSVNTYNLPISVTQS